MGDSFTERNHYNPCFWTALWNVAYFENWVTGSTPPGEARAQEVFALNLRADKILPTKVERVHYDKGLGIAEISTESMKQFIKRRRPEEYEAYCRFVSENPESLYLDFEDILTAVEGKQGYDALMQAARIGGVASAEHKGFLTSLLVMHAMRSHELMGSMAGEHGAAGTAKWEYFWLLKNAWGNFLTMARAAVPLAHGQWTFYRTPAHRFPLCDSPVMVHQNTVMAVLSPRLLLEVNLNVAVPEDQWKVRDGISLSKYREFRRKSILNSFKEIISHDRATLAEWQSLPEFRMRAAALQDPTSARELTYAAARRVVWLIDGMGRVPDDFEVWAQSHFGS